jgi:hypothetical protein
VTKTKQLARGLRTAWTTDYVTVLGRRNTLLRYMYYCFFAASNRLTHFFRPRLGDCFFVIPGGIENFDVEVSSHFKFFLVLRSREDLSGVS